MGRLADKVAIVTGAGSGIGRATALAMAREGARVCAVDIDRAAVTATQRLVHDEVADATTPFACDVSSEADVKRLFQEVEARVGPADVLFNSAGVCFNKTITETPLDDWNQTIAVNLTGVWLTCREFILSRRSHGGPGVIVNTAGVNSIYAESGYAAYCASKGGIASLTKALAVDHASDGIRINCVCPGWIDTPMNDQFYPEEISAEEAKRLAGAEHALLGRIGLPEEVAAAVVFLASHEASFVVGTTLFVDGGMTAGSRSKGEPAAGRTVEGPGASKG
jgi:dihydroanticapsin dehydrogenase